MSYKIHQLGESRRCKAVAYYVGGGRWEAKAYSKKTGRSPRLWSYASLAEAQAAAPELLAYSEARIVEWSSYRNESKREYYATIGKYYLLVSPDSYGWRRWRISVSELNDKRFTPWISAGGLRSLRKAKKVAKLMAELALLDDR